MEFLRNFLVKILQERIYLKHIISSLKYEFFMQLAHLPSIRRKIIAIYLKKERKLGYSS